MPHVPDMIFAENHLRLQHETGFGIEFTSLEALKRVDAERDLVHVASAMEWKEARFSVDGSSHFVIHLLAFSFPCHFDTIPN